jgi:hypothetical protein
MLELNHAPLISDLGAMLKMAGFAWSLGLMGKDHPRLVTILITGKEMHVNEGLNRRAIYARIVRDWAQP